MASNVRDTDKGARALVTRLTDRRFVGGQGQGVAVDVGVIGEGATQDEGKGITTAMVAEWAEFGIGQPMRSWLRGWIEENSDAIDERLRVESDRVLRGLNTIDVGLARIGVWMVGSIQARIARGIEPPNAESTIQKKGSSKPLIDTGQFRSSISSRVVR